MGTKGICRLIMILLVMATASARVALADCGGVCSSSNCFTYVCSASYNCSQCCSDYDTAYTSSGGFYGGSCQIAPTGSCANETSATACFQRVGTAYDNCLNACAEEPMFRPGPVNPPA